MLKILVVRNLFHIFAISNYQHKIITMTLVGYKDGFEVWFNSNAQIYSVYKDNKFLLGGKTKFSEVESYIN